MNILDYKLHVGFLSFDPLIVYVPTTAMTEPVPGISPLDAIVDLFKGACHVVIQPWWYLDPWWITHYLSRLREKYPGMRITVFCAEAEEIPICEAHGTRNLSYVSQCVRQ